MSAVPATAILLAGPRASAHEHMSVSTYTLWEQVGSLVLLSSTIAALLLCVAFAYPAIRELVVSQRQDLRPRRRVWAFVVVSILAAAAAVALGITPTAQPSITVSDGTSF